MDFIDVAPGVRCTTLPAAGATATIIAGESRTLLVDTGASPQAGAALRAAVESHGDGSAGLSPRLSTVVLTHGHWDHAFGLAAFADLETIGAEHLADDFTCAENRAWAAGHGLDLADLPRPRTALAAIGVHNLGGVTVEIAHLGPAHTRSDLILAVPERRLLLVGDLVEAGPPQFDETTSLAGWVATLDALSGFVTERTLVIPGHGTPLDAGHVAHFRTGLAALWDQSEWAFHQGIPQGEVYDFDDLQWPWDRATAEAGIAVAYRELTAYQAAAGPAPTA